MEDGYLSSDRDESDVDCENSLSLSKGCYVHKPKSKSKGSSYKQKADNKQWGSRRAIFEKIWTRINKDIQKVQKRVFSEVIDDIVEFASRSCQENSCSEYAVIEIPTAALVLGVNMPDHALIFRDLEEKLKASVSPYIASLQSDEGKSLASMVQNFVTGLVENTDTKDKSDEDCSVKKQDITFQFLLQWYQEKQEGQKLKCSPRKMKKTSHKPNKKQPVVVIFEDMEAFSASVLQDFILICNNYSQNIPFIFVMGVTSTFTAVHNLLPQKALSYLSIETFHSSPATEYINELIDKVIICSEGPFRLAGKMLQLLVDIVLFHDFSIANFSHMLKLCTFQHYYENMCSILCDSLNNVQMMLNTLPASELKVLCKLPSVISCVENGDVQLDSKTAIQKFIISSLENLRDHHKDYVALVTCLHALTKNLPTSPLGKQLRELYVAGIESKLSESKEYKQAMKLLGMLSIKDLQQRIELSVKALQSLTFDCNMARNLQGQLQDYVKNLKDLEAKEAEKVEQVQQQDLLSIPDFGKVMSRSQLREKLKSSAVEPRMSDYEALRHRLLEYLNSLLTNFAPPCTLPFHEALYFSKPGIIKKLLIASPRVAYHKALMNPQMYLQCKCCRLEDVNQIPSTLPPLSMAYKLYLECGKMINLYDWLQAFKAIRMSNEEDTDKKKSQNKKADAKDSFIHTEFMHSVGELNFLGYVKSSKRKTDHVERLIWGGSW